MRKANSMGNPRNPHREIRIGSLCSAPPLMLSPSPPSFCLVTWTIRSFVSAGVPVPLLLLFRLFELEDTEVRRLLAVAEEVRLLLVGDTPSSDCCCCLWRLSSSMDRCNWAGSGFLLPSLTLWRGDDNCINSKTDVKLGG